MNTLPLPSFKLGLIHFGGTTRKKKGVKIGGLCGESQAL